MVRSKEEVRTFYKRWGAPVLTFWRLFLGDEAQAEEATAEAFLVYLRGDHALEQNHALILLLRFAVDTAQDRASPSVSRKPDDQTLKSAVLLLPCEQRAVFILRNVLRMDAASVAIATGLPCEQLRELWLRSLLAVRELLPKDFFKERTR
ncbi:MAG TPA: hypothetical protein VIH17_13990 [Candidatus Acidoferrales bacterium]